MASSRRVVLAGLAASALAGCARPGSAAGGGPSASSAPRAAAGGGTPGLVRQTAPAAAPMVTRAQVVARYGHLRPRTWGFEAPWCTPCPPPDV